MQVHLYSLGNRPSCFFALFCRLCLFFIKSNNTDQWPMRYHPYIFSRTSTNEPLYICPGVQSIHWLLSTAKNFPLFTLVLVELLLDNGNGPTKACPKLLIKNNLSTTFFQQVMKKSRMFVPINSFMIQVKLPLCLANAWLISLKWHNPWQLYFT